MTSDHEKFDRIKADIAKAHRHYPDKIEGGGFIKIKGDMLVDLLWLVDELETLTDGDASKSSDPAKFQMVSNRIVELHENHTEHIDGNLFLRVAGQLFSEAQFLLNEIERLGKAPKKKKPQEV